MGWSWGIRGVENGLLWLLPHLNQGDGGKRSKGLVELVPDWKKADIVNLRGLIAEVDWEVEMENLDATQWEFFLGQNYECPWGMCATQEKECE